MLIWISCTDFDRIRFKFMLLDHALDAKQANLGVKESNTSVIATLFLVVVLVVLRGALPAKVQDVPALFRDSQDQMLCDLML